MRCRQSIASRNLEGCRLQQIMPRSPPTTTQAWTRPASPSLQQMRSLGGHLDDGVLGDMLSRPSPRAFPDLDLSAGLRQQVCPRRATCSCEYAPASRQSRSVGMTLALTRRSVTLPGYVQLLEATMLSSPMASMVIVNGTAYSRGRQDQSSRCVLLGVSLDCRPSLT